MTDREKYKRTFSVLHASEFDTEETSMKKRNGIRISKRFTAICAAAVLMVAMSAGAYAADIGGIQKKVNIWLHGEKTDAVLDIKRDDSLTEYTLTYTDENGEEKTIEGGGVAMDGFGNQMPLSDQEVIDYLENDVYVDFKDDGTVWVYCRDFKEDITDKFDEDGYCKCDLDDGEEIIHVEIEPNKNVTISTDPKE